MTDVLRPTAIANVLGNAWAPGRPPNFAGALMVPGTSIHLYGKREPRPARKMGHLTAMADTAVNARTRVLEAAAKLRATD